MDEKEASQKVWLSFLDKDRMKKTEKLTFEYVGENVKETFQGEEYLHFTKGERYTAYDVGSGRFVFFDNDNENHGMSAAQVRKWFKLMK